MYDFSLVMSQDKPTLICFDLDDTLIDDNWKFETTFCDCMKAILLALAAKAPSIDDILHTAREMDNQLLKEMPKDKRYMPARLVEAWQATYQIISEKQGIPVKPHIMNMLESYVIQNFEPPYFVIAGAVDALIHIRSMPNVQMHILTVGDPEIQLRKITYTRLNHYFDYLEIVQDGEDKEVYLQRKVKEYGEEHVIMVGNSIRSDINSALNAGARAVHIPRGSWGVFKAEPVHNDYTEVRRIFELPEVLEKMI